MAASDHRGDVAVLRRFDAGHVIEDVLHAQFADAEVAQEHAELAGVEVIGVVGHRRVFGRGDLLRRLALRAQVRLEAHQVGERRGRVPLEPARHQVRFRVALRQHEGMEVVVVFPAVDPALELRTLLERDVAFADEVRLADADLAKAVAHGGPGALAHADGRNIRRFEQHDRKAGARPRAMFRRDDAGGQPTGRATTDDHQSFHHIALDLSKKEKPLTSSGFSSFGNFLVA